jgi:hypothetical protein
MGTRTGRGNVTDFDQHMAEAPSAIHCAMQHIKACFKAKFSVTLALWLV